MVLVRVHGSNMRTRAALRMCTWEAVRVWVPGKATRVQGALSFLKGAAGMTKDATTVDESVNM